MGINSLLKFIKPYVEPVHINKYSGKRVRVYFSFFFVFAFFWVFGFGWINKIGDFVAYSCSMELSLDLEGDKKYQFLRYFMHRINMLRHYKITPVVVFDGGNIPCKATTEDERNRRRKANHDMAMEKLKDGDTNAASELFQRAVSITPQMAHQLIQILRSDNIEFVVAPYEADAQLAYLSSIEAEKGGIAAVISEDSDLLAYGCPAVVFKMDRYGTGEEIVLEKIFNTVGRVPSFANFDKELFTGMCVLAGCDFLSSVPGVGIAKAYNLVAKYRNLARVRTIFDQVKAELFCDFLINLRENGNIFP
ncbi:Exodeoxyribonuclease I [Handroanthus impetiginosus]|uniref:Exonuclease 1 n=1 Tax=Handroanthus impetiginosus TaxID=429701 RepID=A0A2G9HXY9_9LAMI|nr:Exodeoxyribonuclease I [Handroanthus impetiginosus]